MKNASATSLSRNGTLTLTAIFLSGLAVSTSAQNPHVSEIAPETAFTIAPNVQTPMVVKTRPDAACDLHPAGVSDAAQTIRLYANADGYVRVHVTAQDESPQDVRMQLDCAAGAIVTTYPVHLRTGSSPTADMPEPETSVPTPKGARVLPALSDEDAQKLSDQDLFSLGYPRRPDAAASPDNYANWLDLISRPITVLPAHLVSRSDVSHGPHGVEEGVATKIAANWSGYEAHGGFGSFVAVQGEWNMPITVVGAPDGQKTYSSLWVGLDGDGTTDLVQAGTEQDTHQSGGLTWVTYYAWSEVLPNQPTAQEAGISPDPGHDIFVQVWICDSDGNFNLNGGYGCFYLLDRTSGQSTQFNTSIGTGYHFGGYTAEWIMERPCLGNCGASAPNFPELTEMGTYMWNNYVNSATGSMLPISAIKAANKRWNMYENYDPYPDNNELASATLAKPNKVVFSWLNFH